ncbi:MAG: hypoxanthine phosphoribosyltransferase [Armatimonadota bacterium]
MYEDIKETVLSENEIQSKIKELAAGINNDYKGGEIVVISILKGALFFTSDLVRHLTLPVIMDYMAISSYGALTKSSGVVRILKDIEEDIEGKDCLIVEDIVDTGLSANYIKEILSLRNPKSLKICSLLDKKSKRVSPVNIEYAGFEVPEKFLVGYGLDFCGKYRHLRSIVTLKDEIVKTAVDK